METFPDTGSVRDHRSGVQLPTVSVIVPSKERREHLRMVVTPLLDSPNVTEVIVPLSGRDDGSLEMLQVLMEGDARLRVLPVDTGDVMGARASGFEAATGEVALFLDDDVVPVTDLPVVHALAHASGPRQVVVGYMPVWSPDHRPGVASRLYSKAYEDRVDGYESSASNLLSHFWGGNFSLRREDGERLGLRSSRFESTYHEDRDFGLRCRSAGLRPRFVRQAKARHFHDPSMRKFLRDAHRHGVGLVRLEDAHGGAAGEPAVSARWLGSSRGRQRLAYAAGVVAGAVAVAADRVRLRRIAEYAARVGRRLCRDAGIAAERARGIPAGDLSWSFD
jgi:GT2 family glycosyltransferase